MKRIGLIGGVSPESTVVYYRLLNAAARKKLGGEHSADVVIYSLPYGVMLDHYNAGDWVSFKAAVVDAGKRLQAAGCEVLAISSNTTNMAAEDVAAQVDRPFIFLQETLADALKAAAMKSPLLLGTPVTMEGEWYRPNLHEKYGVETSIPNAEDRETVNRIIFNELTHGVVKDESRQAYLDIIERGKAAGADCVILGCTEIGLLIEQRHVDLPVFDTTIIHAAAISDFALGDA